MAKVQTKFFWTVIALNKFVLHCLYALLNLYKYVRRMVETFTQTEAITWGQVYIKEMN